MKRVFVAAALVILCLAALGYKRVQTVWTRQQQAQQAEDTEDHTPLVLDAKTQAILSGADRVETFRLAGGEDEDYTKEEQVAIYGPHPRYFNNYPIMDAGQVQGKAFATSLQKAVAQVSGVEDAAQCFEPGIGFRVWKAKTHVDMCICFYCSGIQIVTPYPSSESTGRNPYNQPTMLGLSRPALLALSKQAFPQDARLAALN